MTTGNIPPSVALHVPPSFYFLSLCFSSSSHLSLPLFLPTCPSSFTGFLSSFSSPPHAPSLLFSPSLLSVSPPFPPLHSHSPLPTLSLLEHCDTVVMVTPIIFWHEWRILYWWDGMAERERERDGGERGEWWREKRQKTEKEKKGRKTTGRENPNDMEMIVPAAYDTKHFHPVICSALMSQRGRCKPRHAESSWGVWDSQGCWRISPQNTIIHRSRRVRSREGDSSY